VEVEGLITVPLEQALNGLPRLDIMRSKSVSQLSSIEMIFKLGTDLLQDRQLVQERLASVVPTLRPGPPLRDDATGLPQRTDHEDRHDSKTQSLIDMSMASYWTIRDDCSGARRRQRRHLGRAAEDAPVQVETDKMAAAHVSLDSVMEATADALDAGILKYAPGLASAPVVSWRPLAAHGRHPHPADQDARVTSRRSRWPSGMARRSASATWRRWSKVTPAADRRRRHQRGPGLMLVVEKFPWGNTVQMTRGIEEALNELRPGLLASR